MTKVLIGIVTHDAHRYAFPELREALAEMRAADILFVDNSATDAFAQGIRKAGFEAVKDSHDGTRIERIIRGRNIIRGRALSGDYTHLLFLDSDVIPPSDALARFLSHGKDIVLGVCLSHVRLDAGIRLMPVLYDFHPTPGFIRPLELDEVQGDRLIVIMGGGFGCCLIRTDVLRRLPAFRNIGDTDHGGEDVAFYKDAREAGFKVYADTGVKCFHMRYPPGDPRNDDYRFTKDGPMSGDFSFTMSYG